MGRSELGIPNSQMVSFRKCWTLEKKREDAEQDAAEWNRGKWAVNTVQWWNFPFEVLMMSLLHLMWTLYTLQLSVYLTLHHIAALLYVHTVETCPLLQSFYVCVRATPVPEFSACCLPVLAFEGRSAVPCF